MATAIPTDYRKSQSDLIYDLIEKSNPGFKDIYPKGSVTFGAPVNVTVDSADPYKRDTSITVTPTAASGGLGSATVKYRRINLTTLLKNMVMMLDNYHTGTTANFSVWLPWWVSRFGFNLTTSDFTTAPALVSGGSTSATVVSTSLCYKGSFTARWNLGKRPITDLLTDSNRALIARLYPGGNNFSAGRKPTGEFMTYTQDASSIKATLEGVPSAWLPGNGANSGIDTICAWLSANTEFTDWKVGDATIARGITNVEWYRYALPSANLPEANSAKFNRAVVIQARADSWWVGKIIIHYNV